MLGNRTMMTRPQGRLPFQGFDPAAADQELTAIGGNRGRRAGPVFLVTYRIVDVDLRDQIGGGHGRFLSWLPTATLGNGAAGGNHGAPHPDISTALRPGTMRR